MKTSSQEVDQTQTTDYLIDVPKEKSGPTVAHCLFAAGLYSASGIGIILINKVTLSGYNFPSPAFLAFLQLIVTTVIVGFLKFIKVVNFAPLSITTAKNIFPLPIFFVGNALSSLGGTARLSVPTLGALRKLSIFMTMVLERIILQKKASTQVQSSVYLMVGGAFVAALEDLDFNLIGYLYILANDVFTAGNNVVTKQKTNQENLGAVGVLFYNALFSIPIAFIFAYPDFGLVLRYENWNNYTFQFLFFLSTVMGCMVTFSTIYCTKINSGLTTSVVGCLRNIVPVYLGMFSVFQYTFNWLHFIGLTISVCGAIAYSYIKWKESKPSTPPKPAQTT